jgi:hypothetical protein
MGGCTVLTCFALGNERRCVVSFTSVVALPQKSYILGRRLDNSQSQPGRYGEKKPLFAENRTPAIEFLDQKLLTYI